MIVTLLRRVLAAVEFLNVALLLTVIAVVLGQVIFRYFLNLSASGSEEAARYLLIVIVMLGASTAVRNQSHMAVGYFVLLHRPRVQFAMRLVSQVVIAAVALLLLVKGFELASRTMLQTSPALRISRGYVAAAIPVGGMLILLALLLGLLQPSKPKAGEHQ